MTVCRRENIFRTPILSICRSIAHQKVFTTPEDSRFPFFRSAKRSFVGSSSICQSTHRPVFSVATTPSLSVQSTPTDLRQVFCTVENGTWRNRVLSPNRDLQNTRWMIVLLQTSHFEHHTSLEETMRPPFFPFSVAALEHLTRK